MVDKVQHRAGGAVVASGWLGADAAGDHHERHLGRAMATSLAIHGALAALLVLAVAVGPAREVISKVAPLEFRTLLVPAPGPGGGGGGNSTPAPRKELQIPKHQTSSVVPVATVNPPLDPPPTLITTVDTNATTLQASGNSLIALGRIGGDGKGKGIGPGDGDTGIGRNSGPGAGDGPPGPGNGISWPEKLLEVKPKYTPDAMRAKVTGTVYLEIVVLETGRVGNVRVTRGLTPDLDQAAITAAKQWVFVPAKRNGAPVAVRVPLELEFRLH